MSAPFLVMTGVSKQYPGIRALDGVDFSIAPGEVVGLVGENGAGKSTLMKILGGVIAPSAGTIELDGTRFQSLTIADAMKGGIAFVHQELNLFENLSAAANIFIGREPLTGGFLKLVDNKELSKRARPLLAQLGADFDPDTPVSELSLAEMQLVEIAKALSLKARLVIMDEPTSSLTASETERLLKVIARLKAENVSVIYVSHRLGEVEHCADRVVVLRDGRRVAELKRGEIEAGLMIRYMIGRELKTLYRPPAARAGDAILELVGIRTAYRPDQAVSLTLRRGEILGVAGLVGSGRTELARTIFGLDRSEGGEIRIGGKPARITRSRDAVEQGVYLVPEDRKRSGLILGFPVRDNITLANLPAHAHSGIVDRNSEEGEAERQRSRLDIRTPGNSVDVGSLSGGNQQKVVLGKWLSMSPRVLIFDEPTRGIDVGAKNEIYRLMRELADSGVGIMMISSDMEEIIGVSDRVAVMHEGRISGFLDRTGLSEQSILSLAVGRDSVA
ncbi:sugar ABC transporter ATP-binding protein [Mesorhizobium sp. BAC0120]|uniref:sugar ABC transporter ATP-binding protein n=1 Tax=Mesorhizobium sp. BAC0120 TaxID=3090670 RepID=UPI00298CEAAE|nr:sugar ABC transporter ATP-binding protein [Mesorhizobium sp. BAC0120]MDW6025830.1 sugar ABC transporter ATP-binding protein [Mesorhizobium sp. BAC0120]